MSRRAKIRGLPQLGTLGAGNHYAEIQVVEEVFDKHAAKRMGIDRVGQVRTGAPPVRAILIRCFWIFPPMSFSALWQIPWDLPRRAGMHNDSQRKSRLGSPGGDGCARADGSGHGPRQNQNQ